MVLLAVTNMVHSEEPSNIHPSLTDQFVLDLGMYFPERNVKIRVDGTVAVANRNIDFEKQVGLSKSDETFSADFGWRFGKKWSLLTQYFQSSGARGAVLNEDIEWNDVVFGQGTNVVAGQDFSVIRAFFGRQFSTSERHDFGLGIGLHWIEIGAFIEGEISVGGGPNMFQRESVSTEAPLPNFGAWYRYSISPKWAFKSRVDWLNADIGDYSGAITNVALGVNYQMFEYIGVGLSYNALELDLHINKTDWHGQFNTSYKGVFAYISTSW
jgi:hypothetical protein